MSSILAWLGVWCLAAGWLFVVDFFLPSEGRGWAFVAAGVLLFILAVRRVRWRAVDPWLYLLLAPLGIAALAWPLPYKAGPLLLLAGLLLALPLKRCSWLTPLSLGFCLAGAVWTVQGGAQVAYWWLGARSHEVPALTPVLYGLARLLGWTAGLSQGSLFLPNLAGPVQATTTWERLGAFPALLMSAGALVLLPLVRCRTGGGLVVRAIAAVGAAAGFLAFRVLVLTAIVAIQGDSEVFWLPLPTVLTFLPLCLVLGRVLPLCRSVPEPPVVAARSPATAAPYAALAGLSFLAGLAAVALLTFPDPGRQKAGRVLLDEYQSNWEWSTQALDTEWYGQKSGYNYYSLGQWLRTYYQVDTNFQPRTPDLLKGYDVLIIKTPTAPFAAQEIAAIEAWVRAGGGLFLIGDHTNVFGTSSYLNPLAQRFGLRFRYDSTYDLRTLRVTLVQPPKLLAHPAVLEMPPFLFATSCTLEAPLTAGNVMVGYGLRALSVDYSRRSFFPDKEKEQDYPFGLFLQSASVRYGRGRVVAFTDSTVFSNFTMFLGGKPEYFLGVMNWLNRSERWPWLDGILAGTLAVAAAGMWWWARGLDRRRALLVVSGMLLLAAAAGPWAGHLCAQAWYRLPQPKTEVPRIAFEAEHSAILLPTVPASGPLEASFQTFYVWTQRLGYVPSFDPTLEKALERGAVVVMIDPFRSFDPAEVEATRHFVEEGGSLLVVAEPGDAPDAAGPAAQLLAPFGLGLEARKATTGAVHNSAGEELGRLQVSGIVTGGEPLLTLAGQAPIVSLAHQGRGVVVVAAFAHPFSDAEMGTTAVVPTSAQRFLYEIEFWLLRGLVSGEFQPLRLPAVH